MSEIYMFKCYGDEKWWVSNGLILLIVDILLCFVQQAHWACEKKSKNKDIWTAEKYFSVYSGQKKYYCLLQHVRDRAFIHQQDDLSYSHEESYCKKKLRGSALSSINPTVFMTKEIRKRTGQTIWLHCTAFVLITCTFVCQTYIYIFFLSYLKYYIRVG